MEKPEQDSLLQLSRRIRNNAYAPYSGFSVGAAALFSNGQIYVGVNVENASYCLTNCAERSAVFAGVTAGCVQIDQIAISAQNKHGELLTAFTPCGACRQVLAEFGHRDTLVIVDGAGTFLLSELLPHAFQI